MQGEHIIQSAVRAPYTGEFWCRWDPLRKFTFLLNIAKQCKKRMNNFEVKLKYIQISIQNLHIHNSLKIAQLLAGGLEARETDTYNYVDK